MSTQLPLNPVLKADLEAILGKTPLRRRLRVTRAFLGLRAARPATRYQAERRWEQGNRSPEDDLPWPVAELAEQLGINPQLFKED